MRLSHSASDHAAAAPGDRAATRDVEHRFHIDHLVGKGAGTDTGVTFFSILKTRGESTPDHCPRKADHGNALDLLQPVRSETHSLTIPQGCDADAFARHIPPRSFRCGLRKCKWKKENGHGVRAREQRVVHRLAACAMW